VEATVIALAGPTGAGKSTLFNALAGAELSLPGHRRPTTSAATAAVWGEVGDPLLDWLEVPRRHRMDADELDGLVLLDLPDFDSVVLEHRVEVERVIGLADLMVWVVDPQKYADASLHDRYLRPFAAYGAAMLLVLNQADRLDAAAREACLADLDKLLERDGLAGVPAVAVSARTGDGVADLRAVLAERVALREAASTRLAADVTTAAAGLAAGCDGERRDGDGDGRRGSGPAGVGRGDRAALVRALEEAAGVPGVVRAVSRAHRRRGALATGWPYVRWALRLRPDPLRRLRLLDRIDAGEPADRASLPAPTAVQSAQVTGGRASSGRRPRRARPRSPTGWRPPSPAPISACARPGGGGSPARCRSCWAWSPSPAARGSRRSRCSATCSSATSSPRRRSRASRCPRSSSSAAPSAACSSRCSRASSTPRGRGVAPAPRSARCARGSRPWRTSTCSRRCTRSSRRGSACAPRWPPPAAETPLRRRIGAGAKPPRMAEPPKPTERRTRVPLPRGEPDGEKPRGWRAPRMRFLVIVLALLALNYVSVALLAPGREEPVRVPYSPTFLAQVRDGNVDRISATGATVEGRFDKAVKYPPRGEGEASRAFETEIPLFANEEELANLLAENDVVIEAEPINAGRGFLASLLLGFGPVILIIALFVFLARRATAGGGPMGALGSFGRSRARRVEGGEQKVTFADVAGIDEAKAELTEIVDFLENPEKYQRLGGRIPRGVLLSGAPGTGKTLLARAVAGQAGVPFFASSASEFVEAIVGIGASRVRDLFKQAKEAAPAIIFIDEMDAIGRSRAQGANLGGNDEREQTLNQILTEMDGFESNVAVIVLGATNRPEVLDPALLRPGRFDRRVVVPAPDKAGRAQILRVHTRSLPLADDVDLERLASTTPGMVGADLANLANEAALTAARRNHEKVALEDFSDALEKIVLGAPRGTMLSEVDKRRVAYHEAGHALVGMLTPDADPVRKVSIIPRGQALGVTFSAPDLDRPNYEEAWLIARIRVALGGRVAEEVVYGTITTGAESDIQQLTDIARGMVGRWGMSRAIGPVAVVPRDSGGPLLPGASGTSDITQRLVDEEVRRIVEEAHVATTQLLTENRWRLEALTEALMRDETLDEDAAYAAAQVERRPADEMREDAAASALDRG
jgi:cell division protease FtsH